ncbi:hypothetical protein BDA99DRAFT_552047 [Phascolomyces articulosus]|uniref:BZIP domain-containing protein n=1 Tax=Phascolomyces articulosus TaxID=60185 RepID=A0AAD5PCM4_9FUNG|nr:hypothetical protein BDA99DRAFT_552047 [Phascolomyces articulosus]
MSSYGLSEFGSPLDSLVFDTIVDTEQSERDAAEELALWSSAQFTFDVNPGKQVGPEEDKSENDSTVKQECPSDMLDPITYEKLVEYLDYELPQQQQQQQVEPQQQQELQPQAQQPQQQYTPIAPIAPAPSAATTPMPSPMNGYVPVYPATTVRTPRQPTLLPKPVALDSLPLASAIQPVPSPQPKPVRKSKKRPAVNEEKTEDQIAADEDKRRRNTAASARFRIKKKMREQAMEQNVQEMKAKSERLQNRVNELELEVKWLRNLLIEKRESN